MNELNLKKYLGEIIKRYKISIPIIDFINYVPDFVISEYIMNLEKETRKMSLTEINDKYKTELTQNELENLRSEFSILQMKIKYDCMKKEIKSNKK